MSEPTTTATDVRIVPYAPEYRTAFRDLNLEWIATYFEVEPEDRRVLGDPETHVLAPGGAILMVLDGAEPIGTGALIPRGRARIRAGQDGGHRARPRSRDRAPLVRRAGRAGPDHGRSPRGAGLPSEPRPGHRALRLARLPGNSARPGGVQAREHPDGAGTPVKGRIVAAFAVVYLVWGSTYLGIRVAVETLPPFLLAGTRFIAAGLLLYAWARIRGAPAPGRREWLAAVGIGILLVAGANAVVGWAEQKVPSGLAALIVAGMPLWVAVFQRVAPGGKPIGRKPTHRPRGGLRWARASAAGTGRGRGWRAASSRMVGLVLASVSWALGSVLSRRVPLPGDSLLASAMSMLAGGVVALGIGVATNELAGFDPARVSAASIAAWAYLVVFGSMLAFTCFTWLVTVVDPTRVATYAYVNPVVALLLGWWLAGSRSGSGPCSPALVILLGLVLVLAARSADSAGSAPRNDRGARRVASGSGATGTACRAAESIRSDGAPPDRGASSESPRPADSTRTLREARACRRGRRGQRAPGRCCAPRAP